MNVLGLKCVGHDTGAALISKGRVVAISEERLTRVKHSPEQFPHKSIDYCLDFLNLKPEEVDLIVVAQERHRGKDFYVKDLLIREIGTRFPKASIESVNHHDAHAASAFFASPFKEAGILVYDGFGEEFKNHLGVSVLETETLYVGRDTTFTEIHKTVHRVKRGRIPYSHGIGLLYTKICQKYIKLGRFNEGKMMGLAPYGNDSFLKKFPVDVWVKEVGSDILVNPRVSFETSAFKGKGVFDTARRLSAKVIQKAKKETKKFFRQWGIFDRNVLFNEITLPRPSRHGEKLPDDYYASVAFAIQKVLEEVALRLAKRLFAISHSENICIAGGVGLNIDANRKILDESGFKHIFIQPGASDAGIPLGAALYGFHMILKQPRFFDMQSASLGRLYQEKEILETLSTFKDKISYTKSGTPAIDAAKAISENKIIGWFTGGSEYGPRALGNRSILCDARNPEMLTIVNKRVKHRELWRPFAASVLEECVKDFFDLTEPSPFMILMSHVPKEKQSKIPSVVHVDGTTRIQTVTKKANGPYYDLIKAFHDLTGVGLVLNTSFNLGGDPIVETPQDAIDSFLRTDIDTLFLEGYVITKK